MRSSAMDAYFLGGQDLEMQEIARVLREHGPRVVDRHLSWSDATFSAYATDFDESLARGERPVLVEVRDIPRPLLPDVEVIDHHGAQAGGPSSLEQVLTRLGIVAMTREQQLISANDTGHIDAMLAIGATPEEIARIRRADRLAQGITLGQEAEAERAIRQTDISIPGLTVVHLPHSRTATITDRLHQAAGGPGYENLWIESPDEVNFYGSGEIVESLTKAFGGFSGGSLPHYGFWGLNVTADDRERVVTFMKNRHLSHKH